MTRLAKLTIMVNTYITSRYSDNPPDKMTDRVKIPGGPLYPAEEIIRILDAAPPVLATRKCAQDAQNLCLDLADIGHLIKEAVSHGQYIDSEWCEQKAGGPIAACDAYKLRRMEWNEAAHKYLECRYYLKFAIAKTGKIVITISCHT